LTSAASSLLHLREKVGWFLAFTAAFAVLAGFVFWGTWSLDVLPVMPDCRTTYPATTAAYIGEWLRGWMTNGKFAPDDIKVFLGSPWFWQELQYALAGYFAALGVAYYCRGRGLSHLAAYGAGLLLAFSGYWFSLFSAGHLGWFRWMTYGVFAFGLADRAVRKNKLKNWLLLGACVAWASFYQPDLWLLFTIFTGVYFIWCCVRERKLPWKGALIALVAFLVIGAPGLLGAAKDKEGREKQIEKGETVQPGTAKDDKDARWIFVTNWSLPADETAEFVIPRLNGDTSCPLTLSIGMAHHTGIKPYTGAIGRPMGAKEGNYRQHSIYVGWITCLLAALGVIGGLGGLGGARREIGFFIGATVLFWLLSLGRNFEPLYRLVFALPIGDSIRCPVKWHHLTELSLAILAAYGIEGLLGLLGRVASRTIALTLIGGIVLVGAFDVARIDRLYCAAQPADYDVVNLVDARALADPRMPAELERQGLRVLGTGNGIATLARKRHLPKSSPSKPLPPMTTATCLGILSLLGTIFVSAVAIRSALKKETI